MASWRCCSVTSGSPSPPAATLAAFVALLAFVVYFNLISLSQSWVDNGRTTLPRALITLHGGMLLLSLAIIWLRDNGNRFCLRRRVKAVNA